MSTAFQYEVVPEQQEPLSLVPGLSEAEAAMKAEVRNWLINGWQTKMPPEGSAPWQIMRQYNVSLPWWLQDEATDTADSQVVATGTISTVPETQPLAVAPPVRRAGRAALVLGGGPKDPSEPGDLRLADKLMHVFPDPRRAKILGIVALNPAGVSSVEVRDQLDKVEANLPIGDYYRDVLELWLASNGLVESDDSLRSRAGRHWRITAEGEKILPAAGHIVDFSASPGHPSPRTAFGLPQAYRMETRDDQPTLGRHRLEQLRHIEKHPKEIITAQDLIDRTNAGGTLTRTLIRDLIDAEWLVVIPSRDRSADEYPLLVPGALTLPNYVKAGFNERFVAYLREWWANRNEPVNLHELIHHRTLLRREVEGGPTAFKLAVFQYAAQLVSQHYIDYERQANFPRTYLALNPAKAATVRNIIGIVDGVARQSPEYQATGLQKLFVALK